MADSKFDINELGIKPGVIFLILSLAGSIIINAYFFPDRGRIIFFSILMSLIAIYTSYPVWRRLGTILFLIFYIILHAILIFLPAFRDTAYTGILLLPFALVDYVLMVIGLRKTILMLSK